MGLALGAARFAVPPDPKYFVLYMTVFATGCVYLALAGLLVILPTVAAILRTARTASAMILTTLLQISLVGLPLAAVCLFSKVPAPTEMREFGACFIPFFVTLDVSLLMSRAVGYRLHWRKWRVRVAAVS
jgi:hypothetical protein